MQAAAPAERSSFEQVYRREFPALAGYCRWLAGDEQLARDTAQEALVRLFARFGSVRDPHAWLYLVATNLLKDHWKRQGRADKAARLTEPTLTAAADGPDVAVRDAVARLPKRLRTVVVLHYFADLRVEDIAEATGLPPGTVKRRLHEARALLAERLGDSDE